MRFVLSGIADRLALGTGRQRFPFSIENQVKAIAEETLNQITTVIESIKAHDLAGEATTAVASFIQRELVFLQNLLGEAVKETELFINACSGHVAFTPDLFNLASSLGSHRAPPKWLVKSATDVSLSGWLSDVQRQVKALGGYLSTSPLHPCSYCLGAFAHPQAFLACVLMDHARVTMKSVYALEFSVEVITHCNNASLTFCSPYWSILRHVLCSFCIQYGPPDRKCFPYLVFLVLQRYMVSVLLGRTWGGGKGFVVLFIVFLFAFCSSWSNERL